jgi:ElaB/YqjD/DUF883 family membrane-anchored ribosome-binding protein
MDTPRTRENISDELETITEEISDGIHEGRYSFSELQEAVMNRTKQTAAATDALIREYPWSAIGLGAALGVLLGLLMARR